MPDQKLEPVLVENADIIFRNFAGREGPYNQEGVRSFCLLLTPKLEERLRREGWNVKELRPREEGDEARPYIQVAVQYAKGRPPRCVMITSRGRTDLGADEVEIFDYAEIKKADLILNPYSWNANGNTGIKAYLKSAYITINEDELEQKYAQLPDDGPTRTDEEVPSLV
jgi:hypothetical protein